LNVSGLAKAITKFGGEIKLGSRHYLRWDSIPRAKLWHNWPIKKDQSQMCYHQQCSWTSSGGI